MYNWIKYGFIVAALLLSACSKEEITEVKVGQEYNTKLEIAYDVEILYSEEAQVKVKVTAPTLLRYKSGNPYTEFPDGIKVEFLNEKQKTTSYLTACHATKKDKKNEIIATDDVEVLTGKGDILRTEHLIWKDQAKRIYGDSVVTIITQTEQITGTGFSANQDFSEYEIQNPRGFKKIDRKNLNLD